MKQVLLLIGTRKGAFLAFGDTDRRRWDLRDLVFEGVQVNDAVYVGGRHPAVIVAGKSEWWGPGLKLSHDLGETWREASTGVRFAEGRELSVARIWVIERAASSDALLAGVDPGALFRSEDGGDTWEEVRTLTEHPTRSQWSPGAGGLMVHCICTDSTQPERLFVGISAAGVFRSDDGGQSWEPKNEGVRADFLPSRSPAVGQCVHHLERHPSNPDVLYQQNHCGVYRSDDAGDHWTDISAGLPGRFGFPLAVHPHDGSTLYVVPETSDQVRVTPGGAFRVYRSRDRGQTWTALTNGLPQVHAYQNVLRAAMTMDDLDEPGLYVGTQGGKILVSWDEGDHWQVLFDWLPPIYSLRAAVIER